MYSFLTRTLLSLCIGSRLLAQEPAPAPDPQKQVPPATSQPGTSQQTPPAQSPDVPTEPPAAPPAQLATTPEVVPTETPTLPMPETAGPGILSRGFTITPLQNENIRFRPFFTLSGITDSGLTSISAQNGQIVSNQSYGIQGGFGITGKRLYKKDSFELEFRGDVYHYTPYSQYDGGNYILNLAYRHYVTKHISLALTETAALYSNNYSLLNSLADLSVGNAQFAVTSNTQLFDNKTIDFSTGADMVIQKSARLSFDLGGTGFLVRRQSSSLYGTIGSQARADTSYRLTRRLTAGGYYAFSHYDFNKAFGNSDVHTGGGIISYTLSKGLELRLRGGASHVQTKGVETIAIDPIIAQILGVSQGSIVIRRTNIIPDISAQLFKTFKFGTASVEYLESVTPGNGLFLTSRHNSTTGHYDYTGIRRWTFSAGGGRDTLSTLGILIGRYTSNTARAGVSRVLTRGFQANAYAEYRHFDVSEANFLRNAYRINLGFAWAPSERPLKLW